MLHPNYLRPLPLPPSEKVVLIVNDWISEEKANKSLASKIISTLLFIVGLIYVSWSSILLGGFLFIGAFTVFLQNSLAIKLSSLKEFEAKRVNEILKIYQKRIIYTVYYLVIGSMFLTFYFVEKYTNLINLEFLPIKNFESSSEFVLSLAFIGGGIYEIMKHRKRIKTINEELLLISG